MPILNVRSKKYGVSKPSSDAYNPHTVYKHESEECIQITVSALIGEDNVYILRGNKKFETFSLNIKKKGDYQITIFAEQGMKSKVKYIANISVGSNRFVTFDFGTAESMNEGNRGMLKKERLTKSKAA